ncbi:hypothetical protein C9374_007483 [Naegleria lovaniensis]|uniref:4'-phosphopantetheinyl transferase domain-containing protein n=1 Tax=Naegleria lovaniensis TaxID=51637 RepID=A0AA88GH73_NAELO|nr:uncharacterized protein C9374_007483 [Naegleria lovaniensis]KAG2379344.1 hypothetical protein C9374_007483 [Naegleria lovaniensis]
MHKLLMKHGETFVKRIYHPMEIEQCPFSFESAFHHQINDNIHTNDTNSLHDDELHNFVSDHTTQEFNQNLSSQQQYKVMQMKIAQYYASRWAAKEATIKALGVSGIGSKQMYVHKQQKPTQTDIASKIPNNYRTRLFPPLLKLEGEEISKILKEILDERNASDYVTHLSLSHEGDMAIANVIIEAIYE